MMVMSGWRTCQICPSLDRSPAPLTAMICMPSVVVSICPLGSERPAGEESSPCIVGLARLGVTATERERIKVCLIWPNGVKFFKVSQCNSLMHLIPFQKDVLVCTCTFLISYIHTKLKLNTCISPAFLRNTSRIESLLVSTSRYKCNISNQVLLYQHKNLLNFLKQLTTRFHLS